jgi:TonB family protein
LPRSLGGDEPTVLDTVSVSLISAKELAPASVAIAPAPAVSTPSPTEPDHQPIERRDMVLPPEAEPSMLPDDADIVLPPRRIDTASLQLPPAIEVTTVARPYPTELQAAPSQQSAPPTSNSGTAARYARSVALAIAKQTPSGVGQKGRVDIELLVAERTGGIESLRVARSSGNSRLDRLALQAVERASYPPPPTELGPAQRTFRVPFNFE